MAVDAFYEWVGLLLHGEGTNGGTVITDSSKNNSSPSASASVITDNTHFFFGSTALKIPSTFVLSYASNAMLLMQGDYTLEGNFYLASNVNQTLLYLGESSSAGLCQYYTDASGTLMFARFGGAAITIGGTAPVNQWFHLAIARQSGTVRYFLNGALVGSTSDAPTHGNGVGGLSVHFAGTGDCWVDELRVTKYVARYTATFTVPTEAFPADDPSTMILASPLPIQATFASGALYILTSPMPAVLMGGGMGFNMAPPLATLGATFGDQFRLTAPKPTVTITGHDATGENAAALTAPKATLTMRGGGAADLSAPSPQIVMAMTGTSLLTMNLSAPMPQVTASGTTSGTMQINARAPLSSLVAYSGTVIAVTGPMGTVLVTGTSGGIGQIAVTCPLFDLQATITANAHAEFDLLAPMPQMGQGRMQAWMFAPMAELVLAGTATVTATYEAYALNLKHQAGYQGPDQVSRYTNFPFAFIVRHANSYYGVHSSGVYLLEGTTDFTTPTPLAITWDWRTGLSDFGRGNKKIPDAVYIGGRMGPASTITLGVGESGDQVYAFATPRGAIAQDYRQKFGKGLKQNYYNLGASGAGELAIDYLHFNNLIDLPRRI